ncbi:MAG TPA: ATP-binding protein [Bacteroidetes bacterium]|nr:ATP-binding protein [Bacteroidota bacterium]
MLNTINTTNVYNPQTLSKEQLVKNFVVREKTFKKLFREIETSKMEYPEQHYMIVGERGMGKTTLLLRLAYEIENNGKLNKWLVPVVFNEEEYGIRKLYEFWKRIADILEEKDAGFIGLREKMDAISGQYGDDEKYGKAVYEMLEEAIQKNKKKIIVFIDNVGDMFSKFSDIEAHRLRKVLQTSADIRIIAASSQMADAFFNYKHPFYEFFKIEQLKGLGQEETEKLLRALAWSYEQKDKINNLLENQKGRVEAMRRLTGGVVRTIIIWFDIFIEKGYSDAYNDVEAILDRMTPIYKHRMDDLPTQQQAIVEAIALNWDAVNVREIKQKTRMESKVISAQITQLVKNNVVTRILTNTKNHLYKISERFFNIWYLMRCGKSGDKKKVADLIQFMEIWCSDKNLIGQPEIYLKRLEKKQLERRGVYMVEEPRAPYLRMSEVEGNPKDRKDINKEKKRESIIDLMAEGKYSLVIDEYGKEHLFNELKPFYYALMYYLQDIYPNEYLRMGDELKETVEEVIAEVEQKRKELEEQVG